MKKLTFVLMLAAVMLFTASPLFAEGMMFGIKGGLNMSNLTGDDATIGDTAPSMKMGFGGGVFFNYAFTEIFAIQVEGLYMMKGATYEWSEGEESGSVDVKIDYIEVPAAPQGDSPDRGEDKARDLRRAHLRHSSCRRRVRRRMAKRWTLRMKSNRWISASSAAPRSATRWRRA